MTHKKTSAASRTLLLAVSTLFLICLTATRSSAQTDSASLVAKMTQMKTTLEKDGLHLVQAYGSSSVYVNVSKGMISEYVVKDGQGQVIPSVFKARASTDNRMCALTYKDKNGSHTVFVPCKDVTVQRL